MDFLFGLSMAGIFFVIITVFLVRAFLVAGGATAWTQFLKRASKQRIVKERIPWNKIYHDIPQSLKILFFDAAIVTLAIVSGLLNPRYHSSFGIHAITFVLFFMWMEIYFYYSHRALHRPRLFWIHRRHHLGRVTNPLTSLSFSILERATLLVGAVLLPGLFSQVIAIPVESYFIYFSVNYMLNVYAHLNVETLPASFVNSGLGKVMNTTTYHALHHLRFKGHYGLFTRSLDRLHRTEFEDYAKVHADVMKSKA